MKTIGRRIKTLEAKAANRQQLPGLLARDMTDEQLLAVLNEDRDAPFLLLSDLTDEQLQAILDEED